MVVKIIDKTIIHRKYPEHNWEYRGISIRIEENGKPRDVVYFIANGTPGVEIYSGSNYIVGSNERSHSRNYNINNVPVKYANVVIEARRIHDNIKWSNANRVDMN